jgi:hypothetical protein
LESQYLQKHKEETSNMKYVPVEVHCPPSTKKGIAAKYTLYKNEKDDYR